MIRKRREPVPEPWMFGVGVTVNDEPVRGYVLRVSLRGRLRNRVRALLGLPTGLNRGIPIDFPQEEEQ